MSESETSSGANGSTSPSLNADNANDKLVASGSTPKKSLKPLPKKRSKSPEEMNQANKGKSVQSRSSKRKKGSESNKNLSKGDTSTKGKFSKKQKDKSLCQREVSSVQSNSVPLETASALNVSNSNDNSEAKIESMVPNDNINKASTSRASSDEWTNNLNDVESTSESHNTKKKALPKWQMHKSSEEKNNSKEENLQNSNQEDFEEELKCIICSEIFINAVTLNCSHSFCQYCISKWRKGHTTCPICRQKISSQNNTLVLNKCVERVLESAREETKTHRKDIIEFREKNKEPDPQPAQDPLVSDGTFAFGPAIINVNGGNIYFDDESSEEDYYDEVDHDYSDEIDEYYDGEEEYEEDEDGNYEEDGEYEVEGEEGYEEDEYEDAEEEDYDESAEEVEEEEYDEEDSYEDADGYYEDEEDSDTYSTDSDDDGRCYNCGEVGHLARACPTGVQYNGTPGAYYGGYGTCFRCDQEGHWVNGCPN